jgi:hypothetical protein
MKQGFPDDKSKNFGVFTPLAICAFFAIFEQI